MSKALDFPHVFSTSLQLVTLVHNRPEFSIAIEFDSSILFHSQRASARCQAIPRGLQPFQRFRFARFPKTVATVPPTMPLQAIGLRPDVNKNKAQVNSIFIG
jgi:hypothetical protein